MNNVRMNNVPINNVRINNVEMCQWNNLHINTLTALNTLAH